MSPVSVSMSCIVLSPLRPRKELFTAKDVALIAVALIPAENAIMHVCTLRAPQASLLAALWSTLDTRRRSRAGIGERHRAWKWRYELHITASAIVRGPSSCSKSSPQELRSEPAID